ncbi:MAG: hypothetical protein HXS50_01510 [Theionarchaea archaeon]|nr:hypothetical protein [Theionarchaea archaeon]
MALRISSIFALLLLIPASLATNATGSEIISCFVIGGTGPTGNPLVACFMEDPLFTYSAEPIGSMHTLEEKRRQDRLYFPRTRRDLVEGYDMMVMVDARMGHFTTERLADLDYAFRDAGMAAFTTFGLSWDSDWVPTTLYDLVPISAYENYRHSLYTVSFHRNRPPVFTPFVELGMEKIVGESYHTLVARQGATIWAEMVPIGLPFLVSWGPAGSDPGEFWVTSGAFDRRWWGAGGDSGWSGEGAVNPYVIDLITNLILYSVDRPLIADIQTRKEARHLISGIQSQKRLVYDLMEWADRFGADVNSIFKRLVDLETRAEEGISQYLDRDYAAAIGTMQVISRNVAEIGQDAVQLKNQVMFWVFVTEWLIVASTASITGVIIWTLMVRRRLYRDTGRTRLRVE